jgi:hypothetical protein
MGDPQPSAITFPKVKPAGYFRSEKLRVPVKQFQAARP